MNILFKSISKLSFMCFTLLLLTVHVSRLKAQPIIFSDDSVLATGYLPYALVCDDFNGDGMPDVAFSSINNQLSNPIQVHLNDGFGKFNIEVDSLYANINDPKGITAGDLNNDQILDLAYVTYIDSTVIMLFGNGDGTFTRGTDLKISSKAFKIVVADFNKDMNNDLAVASYSNQLFIFHGNGQGLFAEPLQLTGAGSVQDLEVADMNKDGYPDLLSGSGNQRSVVMFINDGTGNAFIKDNVHTYRTSWHIKSADFNNDGYEDIIAGSGSYDFDNVYVLLGNETGEYTCPDTLSPASYIDDIIVADFNKDFKADVLIADRHGIYILTGHGDGYFSSADTIDYKYNEYQANDAEAVDMDNDGRLDIVVACDQQVSVYYNTTIITSLNNEIQNPATFKLGQNYPNPFNPTTNIEYSVRAQHAAPQHVNLSIYNVLGQKVVTLVDKYQSAGSYSFIFDGTGLSSGIYFYQLKINNNSLFKKMQLLK